MAKKTMNIELQNDVIAASVLGTVAYQEGRARAPGIDAQLSGILKKYPGHQLPEGGFANHNERMAIMKSWLTSWDAANLAA